MYVQTDLIGITFYEYHLIGGAEAELSSTKSQSPSVPDKGWDPPPYTMLLVV